MVAGRRAALLGLALVAGVAVRVPGSGAPALTHGPLVGAVTDHGAKLWVRSDQRARFRVRYRPEAGGAERQVWGTELTQATDFTGVARLSGLRPTTRYVYRIELLEPGATRPQRVPARDDQRLRTLPSAGEPGKLRVVIGADVADRNAPAFTHMRELNPDFALLIGDNIYKHEAHSLDEYRARYHESWTGRQLRALFAAVPTFMIWDDHEIRDNYWAGRGRFYPNARRAYEEYQHSHNPEPLRKGELYYAFGARDVGFFMLDTRTHRTPNDARDGAGKSMLGAQQKADLLRWLADDRARLKVIVSSVTVSRRANTGTDSWNGFGHERRELLDAIARLNVPGVLFLSGDQHWNGLFRWEHVHAGRPYRFYELTPTPLAAQRREAPSDDSAEILARDDDNMVYGVVDIDTAAVPPRIALSMCAAEERCLPDTQGPPSSPRDLDGARETVPYTLRLTADDFGFLRVPGDAP